MKLTKAQIQRNKETFIARLSTVNRPGMTDFLDWLVNRTDFFTAPAAVSNHGSYEGGLCEHSLQVYEALVTSLKYENNTLPMIDNPLNEYTDDNLIIAGLLHDICKVNMYQTEIRNAKDTSTGQWYPYWSYVIKDTLPLGHGEKSVILIQNFMRLNPCEMLAIRWHMGASDPGAFLSPYTKSAYNDAVSNCPLVMYLQHADAVAAFLMQGRCDAKVENIMG